MAFYRQNKIKHALEVFCPSAPVTNPKRFVGREEECLQFRRAILAPGRHVVLFGGRGVGKTSTMKLVTSLLKKANGYEVIEYVCGERDDYFSIGYKLLLGLGENHSRKRTESYEQTLGAGASAYFARGSARATRKRQEEVVQILTTGSKVY